MALQLASYSLMVNQSNALVDQIRCYSVYLSTVEDLPNDNLSGNRRRREERMFAFARINAGKAAAPQGLSTQVICSPTESDGSEKVSNPAL